MESEKLKEARRVFASRKDDRNLQEDFKKLEKVFFEEATDAMIEQLFHTPTFDRPNYIEGKSQAQMDAEFNKLMEG